MSAEGRKAPAPATDEEVRIAIDQGLVHAVKAYRERLRGPGLADAKRAVEEAMARTPEGAAVLLRRQKQMEEMKASQEADNARAMRDAIDAWVAAAMRGEPVSDFAESFPEVDFAIRARRALVWIHDALIGEENAGSRPRLPEEAAEAAKHAAECERRLEDALFRILDFAEPDWRNAPRSLNVPIEQRAEAAVRRLCREHRTPVALLPAPAAAPRRVITGFKPTGISLNHDGTFGMAGVVTATREIGAEVTDEDESPGPTIERHMHVYGMPRGPNCTICGEPDPALGGKR